MTSQRQAQIAHADVAKAIRDGFLHRQPCEVCGRENGVEAHHDDYTRTLDVRWMCRSHHRLWHSANPSDVEWEGDMISLRLPTALVSDLRTVAKENGRTLSSEVRLAFRAWLLKTMMEKP